MTSILKHCNGCGQDKTTSEFNSDKTKKDGLDTMCRSCKKQRYNSERRRVYYNENKSRALRLNKKYNTKNRDSINLKAREKNKLDPRLRSCYNKVRKALKTGELKKPDVCTGCNEPKKQIEGHHDDYDKPLDVTWLCISCHKEVGVAVV